VLVVVHYRYVEFLFQASFYLKTLGSLDVLEVNTAERRGYCLYGFDEFVGVFLVYFYVESVHAAVNFEQQSFALHNGLAAHGTYVAQAEHCRAVGDYGHKVALVCVLISVVSVFLYLEARLGHARRICKRQVILGVIGFGGNYLYFSGSALGMVVQCSFSCYLYHTFFVMSSNFSAKIHH